MVNYNKTRVFVILCLFVICVESQMAPGLFCTLDHQCEFMFGKASRCVDKKCVCWDTSKNITACQYEATNKKVNLIGFSCEKNENCQPENSICHPESRICVCPSNFNIVSTDRKQCLQSITSMNDSCQDSNQCAFSVQNSICEEGKCICNAQYNNFNDSCVPKSKMNNVCNTDANCEHMENSECKDNVCKCSEGFVPKLDGSMCVAIVDKFGGACSEHQQCHFHFGGGAACIENSCACQQEYTANEDLTHCTLKPVVGADCLTREHCNLNTDGSTDLMVCISGKCQCTDGHYQKDSWCFANFASKNEVYASYNYLLFFILFANYIC